MNTSQILLFALLLILLYLVYTYFIKGSSNKLTSLLPAGSPYVASEETIVKTYIIIQFLFGYT